MCLVFKLNGLKLEEISFLKKQEHSLQRMLVHTPVPIPHLSVQGLHPAGFLALL